MQTLLLCWWVLGIVSAADDQTQRPVYIISQNGSPPGYSSGQPFYGAPVSSNSVKVLPKTYKTSQHLAGDNGSPIPVPVIVNSNTPFQGYTNQPIPVLVSYSDNGSASTEYAQPDYESNSKQKPYFRNVTPIPVLVKAPASIHHALASTPRPFKTKDSQFTNNNNSRNPYSTVSPSFRLWPKLPDPVPVPVLTAEAFVQNTNNLNTNLVPQYLQKVPLPVKDQASLSNGYQENQNALRYSDNSQFQSQQGQSNSVQSNQGPIYIIIPSGNNNAPTGSYQTPTSAQPSYQPQTPQSGNPRYIIVIPTGANSQSNYQNNGYSFNPYFGNQQAQPGQQQVLNNGAFGPFYGGSQTQVPSGQQAPLNYAVYVPPTSPGSQPQTQYTDQQSALKYSIFEQQGTYGGLTGSAEQAPQNYAVFAPGSSPNVQSNTAGQSPLAYIVSGSSNGGSTFSTTTPAPQFAGFSSTQSPSPQYIGYPSSTQSPQYDGYSTTSAPSQSSNSQPIPVSRVSFSGVGNSYSYSI